MPFVGRMDLWYQFHRNQGTLPEPYQKASLWDIQRDLDIGIFGFGVWDSSFYRFETGDVTADEETRYGVTTTAWQTPYGELRAVDKMSDELMEAAGNAARIEFPFKSPADYDALEYILDQTRVTENFSDYADFIDSIGVDEFALPYAGHLPAHQLMLKYMGYESFYLELNDNPGRLERLIQSLERQMAEVMALSARCPADAVQVGGNYDEEMTPPPVFEEFFAPFYRKARACLEASGKVLVIHGDGEMRKILTQVMECGIQAVEALTPSPMTSIDLGETRRLWGNRVVMWGGVASIILTDTFSDVQFESFLERLGQDIGDGRGFILGFGDNVPTDALFDRVKRVAEFARDWRPAA